MIVNDFDPVVIIAASLVPRVGANRSIAAIGSISSEVKGIRPVVLREPNVSRGP